jgi:hypothetical protein
MSRPRAPTKLVAVEIDNELFALSTSPTVCLTPFLASEETVEIVTLIRMIDEAVYLLEHEIDEDLRTRTFHQIRQYR